MAKQKREAAKTQGWPTVGVKGGDIVGGSPGAPIGPRSATRAVNGGGSLYRGSVDSPGKVTFNHQGRSHYYEKGYEGTKTKDEVRKPF